MSGYDPALVRADFPLLSRVIHDHPIAYLDSGATSISPASVITAMSHYYENSHANVHRAVYVTAEEATATYEGARRRVGRFIGAPHPDEEVVFTKNATEAFNLFVKSWGASQLRPGDVVVLSEMEHHANIVPWFQLRDQIGIEIRFIPVSDDFRLDLSGLDELLVGAKVVSVTGMSNVLGTINPVRELADRAHAVGAILVVDAAQSVAHSVTNVVEMGADAIMFSAHKMLGPTGLGVLWVRREILSAMPPFLGGGGMIADVTLEGFTAASGVTRFEAGTPPIAEAAGLSAAVDYLEKLGMAAIADHEAQLTGHTLERLATEFAGRVRILGPSTLEKRGGVISLDVEGVHPHDLAQVLDQFGVCVRPGHHCAKPLMRRFGVVATARVSFGPYSTLGDLDALFDGLHHAVGVFG